MIIVGKKKQKEFIAYQLINISSYQPPKTRAGHAQQMLRQSDNVLRLKKLASPYDPNTANIC